MSAVGEIRDGLKSRVETLLGVAYKPKPFMYLVEDNGNLGLKTYALRIGEAQTSPGTNQHLTWSQSFEVELSHRYENKKGSGDSDLQDKISSLMTDLETVYKGLSLTRFPITAGTILNIAPLDISSPDIDNNVVTIVLSLNVLYRTPIN